MGQMKQGGGGEGRVGVLYGDTCAQGQHCCAAGERSAWLEQICTARSPWPRCSWGIAPGMTGRGVSRRDFDVTHHTFFAAFRRLTNNVRPTYSHIVRLLLMLFFPQSPPAWAHGCAHLPCPSMGVVRFSGWTKWRSAILMTS